MSMFKPVPITYDGQVKTIPANQVLRLISIIEQNFSLPQLQSCKSYSAATVALSYAPILQFAGFTVDEEKLAKFLINNPSICVDVVVWAVDLMQILAAPDDIEMPEVSEGGEGGKKPASE